MVSILGIHCAAVDGEAITIEPKEMSMTVRASFLPEDDARTGRFENIARSTKLKEGRE